MFTFSIFDRVSAKGSGSYSLLQAKIANFVDISKNPWIHYSLTHACYVLSILGSLVFTLSLLNVITAWIESMRDAGRPHNRKLDMVMYSIKVLKAVYMAIGIGQLVCVTMGIFVTKYAFMPLVMIDFIHLTCNAWMLFNTIWMLIDLRKATDNSIRMKRSQLIRIVVLVLFQVCVISSFDSLYMRVFGAAFWVIESCLLMWPKTLVHLDIPPQKAYPTKDIPLEKV